MKFGRKVFWLFILLYTGILPLYPQVKAPSVEELQQRYESFRESDITTKRFGIEDLIPFFERHDQQGLIDFEVKAYSLEDRPIYLARYGNGEIPVLFWSQMHGDESTATMALLDLFNFLESESAADQEFLQTIRDRLTLYFVPMLNPDGAEHFQRKNAANIDLNRDAVYLSNPESRFLKSLVDTIQPMFGFNLHDQSIYYRAGKQGKQVALAFLAPAYDFPKNINEVRRRSMQLIAQLRDTMELLIPDRIAVYDDSFEPRAFGDNVMKWGTSSILIESGGYPGDPEKQYLRELNFLTLVKALESILTEAYEVKTVEEYQAIPENERRMMSLIIKEMEVPVGEKRVRMDVGYLHGETRKDNRTFYPANIVDVGDLSIYSGFQEFSATNMEVKAGKWYPKAYKNLKELSLAGWADLVKQGYLGFNVLSEEAEISPATSFLIYKNPESEDNRLDLEITPGKDPTYTLQSPATGQRWVVHNGSVYTMDEFIDQLRKAFLSNP